VPKDRKKFDVNKSWMKLIAASLLLDALILAAFLTSDPVRSPASTWITSAYKARYQVAPVEDKTSLEAMHKNASKLRREQCVACHGSKTESKLALHRIHLTSDLLPGLGCPVCHKSISLETRTNKFVVRLVDVGVCKDCHSEFPGLKPNSPMKPTDFEVDCTTCHSGKSAYKHGRPYLSHVIAPKECKGCHGGRVLPWTAKHERDDWLTQHGPEALEVGKDSCFKCHEFGLQFCDECHAKKPPTHLPREQWLVNHVPKARADTRACFTCHKADFCKKCHVNHEPDWRQKHDDFVKAQGTKTCRECHSPSFCSFCHAQP